jgi:photosystem II stability/assembly factor-like uncharacterized protein
MTMLLRTKKPTVMLTALVISSLLTFPRASSHSAAASIGAAERSALACHSASNDAAERRVMDALGELPLRFEETHDRANNEVKFTARAAGIDFGITPTEAVMRLHKKEPRTGEFARTPSFTDRVANSPRQNKRQSDAPRKTTLVRMALIGANRRARMNGEDQLPTQTNYFIGNDASRWRTDVANYARVRVQQAYSGVDVVYYGSGQRLEYDFKVAPGATYKAIRLGLSGAKRIAVDESGDLTIVTAAGIVRQHGPVAYQLINGIRREVPARYSVGSKREVRFLVDPYDRRLPLVIDPVVSYSTYLGGTDQDAIEAVAIGSSGSAYVIGTTRSINFPTTPGGFQTTRGGGVYTFVTKFNLANNTVAYSTYIGGQTTGTGSLPVTNGAGIAIDSKGSVYVTGGTTAIDFPTTPGAFQTTRGGTTTSSVLTAFVTKLSPDGNALTYSTYLGGSSVVSSFTNGSPATRAAAVAVDGFANAYVAGSTNTGDFPTTANALLPNKPSGFCTGGLDSDYPCNEGFVTKLNPSGTGLVYSTYLGGSGDDFCNGIALDSSGNAYVVGTTVSLTFPTARPIQPSSAGGADAFVSKLNAEGTALIYSTYLGGGGSDFGNGIAVDSAGNAYVAGTAYSTDLPVTSGSFQPASAGVTLFKSTDGGMHWQASNKGLPGDFNVHLLAVDRTNPSTIYAGISSLGPGGVFKSVDGGSTWSGTIAKDFVSANILIAAFDPRTPSTSYAGFNRSTPFNSEVQKSLDGGRTWFSLFLPFQFNGLRPGELAIDPTDSAILYFATRFKSSDGGFRWKEIGKGLEGSGLILAFDPTNSSILYASVSTVFGKPSGLFKSTSGGKKWIATDLSNVTIQSVAFDPLNQSRVYAGGGGLFKSDDHGETWKAVKTRTTLPPILQLIVDPVDSSTVYANTTGGFFKSTNRGKDWIAANAGLPGNALYVAIDPKNPSTLYAGSRATGSDAFVAKVNAAGSAFAYLTYLGGSSNDGAREIAVDQTGSAYVTGATESNDFPTRNAVQPAKGAEQIAHPFLTKLNPGGASVDYSTYLGGSSVEEGRGVAVDSTGAAYVVGFTTAPDLPTTANAFQKVYGGAGDGFLIKLIPTVAAATSPGRGRTPGSN